MLFYIYESNKIGKRIKGSFVCRELVGLNVGAFGYEIDRSNSTENLYILDVYVKKQTKKMLFFNGEDSVCLPLVRVIDGKSTCKDIKLQIFKYIFPLIQFPKSIKDKISSIDNIDEKIEMAYNLAFEETKFGEEELYELQLINNRESYEG
mmetsp:Transcript_40815/g.46792  ORF Transcript_40815/g.46792 Transcript_40815/m.46792 type:complete len:150 (+) Transcript_40815:521-970(+)|eukprot:CAMPEP_0168350082 /NCGR_PEP_ID=MMETSP0213-20121227/20876_1 /TAXON_ID=151035 /ORGANISM="Euplotes harpa, Strain FSP1.4" /LENGTH=149 /DNA_ID=CAMNT_0008360299 /DNA_START=579 /DNA_END=1028 /DNA_ORIENTATION=+